MEAQIAHTRKKTQPYASDLAARLERAGLGDLAPQILALARPSIRLTGAPQGGDGANQPGASRLGGLPDLPPGSAWPVFHDQPMSFVAQVRLDQAALSDPQKRLPVSGLLSFFYDSSQSTYGADPNDRGGWQVLYTPGDLAGLKPLPAPPGLPRESQFTPVPLGFSTEITLPSAPAQVDPGVSWSDAQVQAYEAFLSTYPSPQDRASIHHRMLGYPDQIQDDMQLESALASSGFHSLSEPGAAQAAEHKADWVLLLQVDSDPQAGMRWGSAGMIYYWIKQADLAARQFGGVWLVMQSD